MSGTATLNRLCERSEAIQSGLRASWIATSPSVPRNDGTRDATLLGDFVASCESNFLAQRHEGTMGFLKRILEFMFKSLRSDDSPHPNPSPEGKGLDEVIILERSVR